MRKTNKKTPNIRIFLDFLAAVYVVAVLILAYGAFDLIDKIFPI